ncbi:hypothetical protein GQ55_5G035300 [Panicum hallii var. hallii]|uniref:Uncharacterized protein n=1 Tax=Panicum hallii var. hallii TaxID=1504633 RepID=A0A2T7DCB5_9POAL|nr:hypothetical protein GQ55_5G035300 [Panicum hallii var. hallii]
MLIHSPPSIPSHPSVDRDVARLRERERKKKEQSKARKYLALGASACLRPTAAPEESPSPPVLAACRQGWQTAGTAACTVPGGHGTLTADARSIALTLTSKLRPATSSAPTNHAHGSPSSPIMNKTTACLTGAPEPVRVSRRPQRRRQCAESDRQTRRGRQVKDGMKTRRPLESRAVPRRSVRSRPDCPRPPATTQVKHAKIATPTPPQQLA